MAKKIKFIILSLLIFVGKESIAQSNPPNLNLSVQTDLLAYTTLGGYSTWLSAEHKRHKLSIAFVNYPNRFRGKYDKTGIKESPSWLRFQFSQKFKPTSKLKNFHYGLNVEHHWRQLEEDNNSNEVLNDTHWQYGIFIGYDWQPWNNKENRLRNIFITPWIGGNFLPTNTEMTRVFENTGSIYDIPSPFRITGGINIGYTFYQKKIKINEYL